MLSSVQLSSYAIYINFIPSHETLKIVTPFARLRQFILCVISELSFTACSAESFHYIPRIGQQAWPAGCLKLPTVTTVNKMKSSHNEMELNALQGDYRVTLELN